MILFSVGVIVGALIGVFLTVLCAAGHDDWGDDDG